MLEKDAMKILMKFLDKKAREAEREITRKGVLSDDKAIPLILMTQFNHIAHLEGDIRGLSATMDERFKEVDRRFEAVDQRFEQVNLRFERMEQRMEKYFFSGVAFLSLLMTFYRFLR